MPDTPPPIRVNRARALTLSTTVVVERLGYRTARQRQRLGVNVGWPDATVAGSGDPGLDQPEVGRQPKAVSTAQQISLGSLVGVEVNDVFETDSLHKQIHFSVLEKAHPRFADACRSSSNGGNEIALL